MKAVEMTPNEMIKDLNLKNALIDYHYDVNEEFQNVDDIEDSENMIDYIIQKYKKWDIIANDVPIFFLKR